MDAKVNGETEEPDETTHRVLFVKISVDFWWI